MCISNNSISKKITNIISEKFHFSSRILLIFSSVILLFTFSPFLAFATPTIGDIGNNVGNQSTGLTSGALRIFGFVGICMVGLALIKGRTAKNSGETLGSYIAMGVVGALLFSIAILISVVNTSIIGTDASKEIQDQIIQ